MASNELDARQMMFVEVQKASVSKMLRDIDAAMSGATLAKPLEVVYTARIRVQPNAALDNEVGNAA